MLQPAGAMTRSFLAGLAWLVVAGPACSASVLDEPEGYADAGGADAQAAEDSDAAAIASCASGGQALPEAWGISPSIAAGREGEVVILYIPYGEPRLAYVVSRDHGETFTSPRRIEPAAGRHLNFPSLASDAEGNVYAAWISYDNDDGLDSEVQAARFDPIAEEF